MKNLGLYVHIPFCKSKCYYCNFNSIVNLNLIDQYVDALIKEIEIKAKGFKEYEVDTIFVGGGTPSIITSVQFEKICKAIKENYSVAKKLEFSVECNPDSITCKKLKVYKKQGVNRISVGVQSFFDDILKIVGRIHKKKQTIKALKKVSKYFNNYNIDFMLGLPTQTPNDVDLLIKYVKKFNITHVSAYGLKIENNTKLEKMVSEKILSVASDDESAQLYDYVVKQLSDIGIDRYEVSNFAKKGCECKHNYKYWDLSEYLGIGVSAHSYYNKQRAYNIDDINEYIKKMKDEKQCDEISTSEEIDLKDSEFEYIMLSLRTREGLNIKKFRDEYEMNFLFKYQDALEKHKKFFQITDEKVCLTNEGFYVMNSLLVDFMDIGIN